jgi:hypothetical protein
MSTQSEDWRHAARAAPGLIRVADGDWVKWGLRISLQDEGILQVGAGAFKLRFEK